MTCQQLQSTVDEWKIAGELCPLGVEATQHVSECESCRCFVQTQKDLLAGLCLLRETAPGVSDSLDAAVLANYREAMRVRQVVSTGFGKTYSTVMWRLGVVAAAAMVIFAAVFFVRRSAKPTKTEAQPLLATEVTSARQPDGHKPVRAAARRNPRATKTTFVKPNAPVSEHFFATAPVIRPDDSGEFRSLMYCDQLSCDGGMNVVRVQLPALPSGFLPAASTGARPVSADVLVGADGFARGIRIVH